MSAYTWDQILSHCDLGLVETYTGQIPNWSSLRKTLRGQETSLDTELETDTGLRTQVQLIAYEHYINPRQSCPTLPVHQAKINPDWDRVGPVILNQYFMVPALFMARAKVIVSSGKTGAPTCGARS